jgi:hypothetical protein
MEPSFEIVSYIGPKPLLFGMTERQVEAVVGHPQTIMTNGQDEPNAFYESFSIRYSKREKKLVEIGFLKTARVKILAINPFTQKNGFRDLVRRDSCPYECFGFIVLLDLGITLTGFHDNDPDQLAITAFVRGRWDDSKSDFKRFQFS